jgi:SAM-dependent methyltransferase
MESPYYDSEGNSRGVAEGLHRVLIGGLWDEIGSLQFDYLKAQGLQPHHKLLDVGCGSLRGGVHFVAYLDSGHYFGMDMHQAFLDAGYEIELAKEGLCQRLPRANLICTAEFATSLPDEMFDFAIAQSVFSHLGFNRIRQCLQRLVRLMKPGGRFYATFFEVPAEAVADGPIRHEPGGIVSYPTTDPYHYSVEDLRYAARGLPWTVHPIGAWEHPRAQHMIAFERIADPL